MNAIPSVTGIKYSKEEKLVRIYGFGEMGLLT
jgi:hypothetical protein